MPLFFSPSSSPLQHFLLSFFPSQSRESMTAGAEFNTGFAEITFLINREHLPSTVALEENGFPKIRVDDKVVFRRGRCSLNRRFHDLFCSKSRLKFSCIKRASFRFLCLCNLSGKKKSNHFKLCLSSKSFFGLKKLFMRPRTF